MVLDNLENVNVISNQGTLLLSFSGFISTRKSTLFL